MSEQRPFSPHPHPTPNVARPKQPRPNPSPNMTPEAEAAARKNMKTAATKSVTAMITGAYKKATATASTVARQGSTQGSKALADRRDQMSKLKGEY